MMHFMPCCAQSEKLRNEVAPVLPEERAVHTTSGGKGVIGRIKR
jgi:hypothetical protein